MQKTLCALALCLLAYPTESAADAIDIHVLDTQYTTNVSTHVRTKSMDGSGTVTITDTSRTQTSTNPVADSLQVAGADWARAEADLFSVAGFTNSLDHEMLFRNSGGAAASAESWLQFTPDHDGFADLGIVVNAYDLSWFTAGFISLWDVTLSQELWMYEWAYQFQDNFDTEWVGGITNRTATINLAQVLSGSHVYELTMYTRMNAADDSEGASIHVSGLRSVPEPSSMLLIGTALAGIAAKKLRRRG